jgi:2-polyprenyl-3-methyl-5-hydroxy-6-metoxy-1,4-benzoquinol methylase
MAALLPRSRDDFGKASYWDKFNSKTQEFEWYGSYSQLAAVVKRYISPTSKVLVIGCGNSNFSAELYDSGVVNITNVDFDEKVINDMISRNQTRTSMKWLVMDMKKMNFECQFDVVFDKGALEALYSSPENKQDAVDMIDSISQVMTADGIYACVR